MAEGLSWILNGTDRRNVLGRAVRVRTMQLWSPEVVPPQYQAVCRSMLERSGPESHVTA